MSDIKKIIWYVLYTVLTSLFLLVAFEIAVRALFPHINYQGNQRSMFVENKFHKSMGLRENSSGKFFGKEIKTDEFGFRQMNTPLKYDKSWLILGDSVTFGVAIEKDLIFPQLIQNTFQNKRIWNTAVVGYSSLDYLNVAKDFIPEHDDLEKIILFFCLNDIYGNLSLDPDISVKEAILSFLRSNSKLYLLLKKFFFDRSKAYALHDIGLYKESNSKIIKHLKAIVKIKSIADKSNIQFLVVVLPYEYQLRVGGLKDPQIFLENFFRTNNIQTLSLYDDFSLHKSKEYFLYGDPMHLSYYGHKTVANKIIKELK